VRKQASSRRRGGGVAASDLCLSVRCAVHLDRKVVVVAGVENPEGDLLAQRGDGASVDAAGGAAVALKLALRVAGTGEGELAGGSPSVGAEFHVFKAPVVGTFTKLSPNNRGVIHDAPLEEYRRRLFGCTRSASASGMERA